MIYVNEPYIAEKEIEYVNEAIKSGWISSEGRFIKEFESRFSQYIDKKYGIAVNNGTNALILALRVLNLPRDSEIILPTFTIISCALACIYNNLIPVFIDSEHDTWNMDVWQIEDKITDKTKAIMVVHIYGHPVDMEKVIKIAKKYNLYIIEDAAEAIGSEYRNMKCGKFGDISCFSFYANKVITTGEGGMCLTDNKELADRMISFRNLAFLPEKRFYHFELGYNFRITNVQSAIGLAQIERINEHVKKKVWIGKTYTELLKDIEEIQVPVEKEYAKNTYWMYGIVLKEETGIDAEEFAKRLLEKGIQTRPFFYPLHLQPVFKTMKWYRKKSHPVSEKIAKLGLYLPSGLTITEEQIQKVVNVVKEVIKQ